MRGGLFLGGFLFVASVSAYGRGSVPLMPPSLNPAPVLSYQPPSPAALSMAKATASVRRSVSAAPTRAVARPRTASVPISRSTSAAEVAPNSASVPQTLGLGAQLGMLLRRNATFGSLLGTDVFLGGRFFVDVPLRPRISLRPSLGYFATSSGETEVSVWQHDFEAGVTAYYDVLPHRPNTLKVGLAQYLTASIIKFSVLSSSDSSPIAFSYRAGPSVAAEARLTPRTNLLFTMESTFEFSPTVRPFIGATVGFIFRRF